MKKSGRRIGLSNRNGTDEQRGDTEWVKFLNWNRGNRQVLVHIIVLSIKFTLTSKDSEILPVREMKNGRSQKFRNKVVEVSVNQITNNLLAIIKSIIARDTTGTDSEKLKSQIKAIEQKRTNLIDLYTSGDITRDEFSAARAKCENEIAELQSVIDSIDKQREMIEKQQELVAEITEAMNELINGVEYEDDFYKEILDKMVVNDKDHIDVYLNLLPLKWSYTVAKSVNCPQGKPLKKAGAPEMEHFRGFSTDVRKHSRHLPVRARVPLGQIAHGSAHLSVRAAVLADDGLCDIRVGLLDVYGKL